MISVLHLFVTLSRRHFFHVQGRSSVVEGSPISRSRVGPLRPNRRRVARRQRHAASDFRRRRDLQLASGSGGTVGAGVDEDVVGAVGDASVVDGGRQRRRRRCADGGVAHLVVSNDQQRRVEVRRRPTARACGSPGSACRTRPVHVNTCGHRHHHRLCYLQSVSSDPLGAKLFKRLIRVRSSN